MVRALPDDGTADARRELVIVNVLVFNPGSSSLKFEVIAADRPSPHSVRGRKLVSGVIEPIGGPAKLFLFDNRKAVPQEEVSAPKHGHAPNLPLPCSTSASTPPPRTSTPNHPT